MFDIWSEIECQIYGCLVKTSDNKNIFSEPHQHFTRFPELRVDTDLVYSLIEYVAIRVSNASSFSINTTTLSPGELSSSRTREKCEVRDCGILWLSVTGRNKTVPRSVVSNVMLSLPGLVPPTPTVNREGGSQQSIGVIVMSFYICDWWLETKSNHTTSSSCVLVCCEGYTKNIATTNQYKLGYNCKHFFL